jgi:hypothetical protein
MAIPPDEEVPFMLGMAGLVCYPSLACCSTHDDLLPSKAEPEDNGLDSRLRS